MAKRGPVALVSHGRVVAAIVSAGDLEDLEDIREADKALAEYRQNQAAAVPWERIKREAGLA